MFDDTLVYRMSIYLVGLDETVTIVKDPTRVAVVRPGGCEQAFAAVMREERDARVRRFGALDPALVRELDATSVSEVVPLAVHLHLDIDWSDTAARLHGHDESVRAAAADALRRAIGSKAAVLVPRLEALGLEVRRTGETMPIVFGRATAASTRAIGRLPGVDYVAANWARPGHDDAATDLVLLHHIDTAFNLVVPGVLGTGQKVGFLELMQNGYRIYDAHEAFSQNGQPPTYQNPVFVPCSTHAQCDPSCAANSCIPSDPYVYCDELCIDGKCIDAHTSKVASVVSATRQGTPWSAARASLYFANGILNPCDKMETQQAFDWFVANEVNIVNESYSCNAYDDVGQVEDFYSFIWGVNVTKSAGNQITGTACPNHLNAICVGATDHGTAMASYSSWQNPTALFGGSYDREEPDVAALGGGGGSCTAYDSVDVLGYQSATDWGGAGAGTSFSAPIVAAMIALLQEKCGGSGGGGHMPPLSARAIMAQAAWAVDPDGPFPAGWWYSTPAQGKDNKDGAGFDLADLLGCPGGNVMTIDLTQGVLGPNGYSYPPPGGPPPQSYELRPQSSGIPPGPADGRLYQQLAAWSFPNGGRLRYSIHWDACAIDPFGLPQAAVVPDFDLFLFDRTRGRYYYASQSNNDNNEGFDVTIPATSAGQYEVWLAWPNGAQGCMGMSASVGWESVQWGGQ